MALAAAPLVALPTPSLSPLPAPPPVVAPVALPTPPVALPPPPIPLPIPPVVLPTPPVDLPPLPVTLPPTPVPPGQPGPPPTSPPPAQDPTPAPSPVSVEPIPPPAAGDPASEPVSRPEEAPRPVGNLRPQPSPQPKGLFGIGDLVLPPGPAGVRLAIALFAVPALLVLWLLVAVRTGGLAVARRRLGVRTSLAAQLGLPAEQLASVDEEGLETLRERVAVDALTHVASRAAGMAALEREVARARREGGELSVIFVDVDGLKALNDGRGHAAGDRLLQCVAGALTGRLRANDLVFRYGGDEFVCVLAGTPEAEAVRVAGEMRKAAGRACSFSYGVAALEVGEDADALLARADARQYREKKARHACRER